jgi:Glycosyltransferases involved in cell wall biogenesis
VEVVSVIIPAYNAAAAIAETIASAQEQTYQDLEILVVDDGSTDDTAAIVEEIAARDTRVRLLRQSNQGVASARNFAIRESRGSLLAPLDADDLWHPEKIARQISIMRERGPTVGLVYAWSSSIDEQGQIIRLPERVSLQEGSIFPFLIIRNLIGNGSVPLLRRTCVIAVGGYDPSLRARGCEGCEDLLLYLTIAARYDVAVVPAFLIGYRKSAVSMSRNVEQMRRSRDLVIRTIRARHPELPGRIFRWATALNCWQMAGWMHHVSLLTGSAFCARTFAYDPGFLFEPPLWISARRTATRLAQRVGLMDGECERGLRFLESRASSDGHLGLNTRLFSRRRYRFLQSQAYATSHRGPTVPPNFNTETGPV